MERLNTFGDVTIVLTNLFWKENEVETENILGGFGKLFKVGEDFKGPPVELLLDTIVKKLGLLEPRYDPTIAGIVAQYEDDSTFERFQDVLSGLVGDFGEDAVAEAVTAEVSLAGLPDFASSQLRLEKKSQKEWRTFYKCKW